jgi:hypothetical protein
VSKIGVEVNLRTPTEIFDAAQAVRDKFAIGRDGRIVHSMEWMFTHLVPEHYGVHLDVVDDHDATLRSSHAEFDVRHRVLKVRQGVFLRCDLEEPEAIFTMSHELGHIVLHGDPKYFRRTRRLNVMSRSYIDPEMQADRFALEFLVDRKMLERYDEPRTAASYFRVPLREMQLFFATLRSEGSLVRNPQTLMDKAFDTAMQVGFDF